MNVIVALVLINQLCFDTLIFFRSRGGDRLLITLPGIRYEMVRYFGSNPDPHPTWTTETPHNVPQGGCFAATVAFIIGIGQTLQQTLDAFNGSSSQKQPKSSSHESKYYGTFS